MNRKFEESIDSLFSTAPYLESPLFSLKTSEIDWLAYIRSPDCPLNEKNYLNTKRRLGLTMERMRRRKLCDYCWLNTQLCICSRMKPTSSNKAPFQFHILMHSREFAKLSNTGRIIARYFDAPLYIGWNPHSEQTLQKLFEKSSPENLFVLFLDKDAISMEKLQEITYNYRMNTDNNPEETPSTINIILIDSTWNEAKALQSLIPRRFPRVSLNASSILNYLSLLDPVRCRTRKSGVCTAEALMLFLKEISCEGEHLESIQSHLKHLIDIIKLEKHSEQDVDEIPAETRQKFIKSLTGRS